MASISTSYKGKTVYFFRKSGMTGEVGPLGTAVVSADGKAVRQFNARKGQAVAVYAKILGAPGIETPYSPQVSFKMTEVIRS